MADENRKIADEFNSNLREYQEALKVESKSMLDSRLLELQDRIRLHQYEQKEESVRRNRAFWIFIISIATSILGILGFFGLASIEEGVRSRLEQRLTAHLESELNSKVHMLNDQFGRLKDNIDLAETLVVKLKVNTAIAENDLEHWENLLDKKWTELATRINQYDSDFYEIRKNIRVQSDLIDRKIADLNFTIDTVNQNLQLADRAIRKQADEIASVKAKRDQDAAIPASDEPDTIIGPSAPPHFYLSILRINERDVENEHIIILTRGQWSHVWSAKAVFEDEYRKLPQPKWIDDIYIVRDYSTINGFMLVIDALSGRSTADAVYGELEKLGDIKVDGRALPFIEVGRQNVILYQTP